MTTEEIAEALEAMSVLELVDLSAQLEQHWASVQAAADDGQDEEVSE